MMGDVGSSQRSYKLTTSEVADRESSITDATTENTPATGFDYVHFSLKLFVVLDPIIFIAGLVGNSLLVTVMSRKSLRTSSVSVYMTALAVADILVLLLDFINNWFKLELKIYLLGSSHGFCKFHRFFFNVCYTYSGWLVVSLAAEKFIAVWLPFRAKSLCTRRNAVIAVCLLPAPIIALFLYNFWAWEISDMGQCDMVTDWVSFQSNVGPWLTATLHSYVPIIALISLNGAIIYKLYAWKAQWQGMGTSDKTKAQETSERRVTVTIVVICVFYVLLTLPISLFYIILFFAGEFINTGPKLALAENLILIFGLCNHSINFFLYVTSSGKFRSELSLMFASLPCVPSGGRGSSSIMGSATGASALPSVSQSV